VTIALTFFGVYAFGIEDRVDLDDPAVCDSKPHHCERPTVYHHDNAGRAIDDRSTAAACRVDNLSARQM
jgi:hypothetical protein